MAAPTVTYTFTNGTTADATEVNANFTDIINALTDGTSDFSIGAFTCSGTLTANGAVNLGNATSDDITITGSIASNIPIKTADTYNIGSAALGLNAVYFGDNGNSVGVKADASASADWVWSFPPAAGTKGYVPYDSDGAGDIQWAPVTHDINAVSDSYTVLDDDGYRHILVTTSTTNRTITLPTAANNTDRMITIKKVDSGSGRVSVDGEGAETIDGQAAITFYSQYDYITVVCDGTSWHVVDQNIQNRIEIKTLQADETGSSGTMSDLTFSNLITGKWYRVSGQVYFNISGTGTRRIQLDATHNGSVIGTWYARQDSDNFTAGTNNNGVQFLATATSLTFVYSIGSATILGNNSQSETHMVLEELNNAVTTTSF